jgi:DNA repair protein SbcD/Mre11
MKLIHTSDWHLGRSLYGRKRYEEFSAFLDWLLELIQARHIDALLVAGDIFDTTAPSNRAQELYYRFLARLVRTDCRHIIITAGNHDSPTFLEAPQQLLKALDIQIIGSITDNPSDEVILLRSPSGEPEAVICAVPYLRDRDVRRSEAGESLDDKNRKLIEGVRDHYHTVCEKAEEIRRTEGDIPVIAMGHLFASGGKTLDGDGVRELYVGSLAHIGEDAFPETIDYLALGHLHVPQQVGKSGRIRYSGSPVPMGYGEAKQTKQVVEITAAGRNLTVGEIPVPCFQPLQRIAGDLDTLLSRIEELAGEDSRAWLEIEYLGEHLASDLREQIDAATAGTRLEVRRIRNRRITDRVLQQTRSEETLDDLDVHDVFERCLDAHNVTEEERPGLTAAYREIIASLYEKERADGADEAAGDESGSSGNRNGSRGNRNGSRGNRNGSRGNRNGGQL